MKGHFSETLPYGNHRIVIGTPVPLLVSVDDDPVRTLAPGNHRFVVKGGGKLSLDTTDAKAEFTCKITSRRSQPGEEINDDPPPQPPAPENFLQQIRMKVRQQLGVTREAFAERSSIYETDTELFEEDEERIAQARARQEAKEAQDASAKGTHEETATGTLAKPGDNQGKPGEDTDEEQKGKTSGQNANK